MKSQAPISKSWVVAIVGPTASGKSEVAVRLARRFHGEVVSADSRQVYRGMNIGTGKVPRQSKGLRNPYIYKEVRHYLIDVVSPRRTFTVVRYQKLARKALLDILRRGKLPIIAGGTGFYIDSLLSNQSFPPVPPQLKLRRELEKLSTEELFRRLEKLDPERAFMIDRKNRRRLVRALEIVLVSRDTKVWTPSVQTLWKSDFHILKVGILVGREELKKKIGKRLRDRLRGGMIEEVRRLREKDGLSWERLDSFGLEYRYVSWYLRGLLSYEEMIKQLERAIYKYAKRQMTWFRRDRDIRWIRKYKEAERLVRAFCNV